jgi:hypothetical protein
MFVTMRDVRESKAIGVIPAYGDVLPRDFVARRLPPVFRIRVTPIGFSIFPLKYTFEELWLRISIAVGAWSRRMSKLIGVVAPAGSV